MIDLIIIPQGGQYDSVWELVMNEGHLLCNDGPHLLPVVNISILRGQSMSNKVAKRQNHVNFAQ